MSARSAGLPINAARPPALKAQPAFSKKDICFPGVFTLEGINGNFRILKWRYVSTIFLAIFYGDIHLHRPKK
jgi:hypothetical protein